MNSSPFLFLTLTLAVFIITAYVVSREIKKIPKGGRSILGGTILSLGCLQAGMSIVLSIQTLVIGQPVFGGSFNLELFQAVLLILLVGVPSGLVVVGVGRILNYAKSMFVQTGK